MKRIGNINESTISLKNPLDEDILGVPEKFIRIWLDVNLASING